MAAAWDLTALINAADPKAPRAQRHLWLARLLEWLRDAPAGDAPRASPLPVVRLRHLLGVLDRDAALRQRVQRLLLASWREVDAASALAYFGFGARASFGGELLARVGRKMIPGTPDTDDLAALLELLFRPSDAAWIEAIDDETLARLGALIAPPDTRLRDALAEAIAMLSAALHARGFAPELRARMDPARLLNRPFRETGACGERLRAALQAGRLEEALREATLLRALLDACREAARSVRWHLDASGISVGIIYQLEQIRAWADRIELLLDAVLAPAPAREWRRLVLSLLAVQAEQRGVRALLGRHYSQLARKVAERNAETGGHYITRDAAEYRQMLGRAAGGGAVIAGTTFVKFWITALGLGAFWTGFAAGLNYAASFVVVMLLHWTVATKQPAMTAPAMAASLPVGRDPSDGEIEGFVDRVAQLIRSQAAGIIGNLALCGPIVFAVQWLWSLAYGSPLVGTEEAEYVLHSLTLLGPTALFAAFTGVLLFASSLIAGWAENAFVYHRLDSAIEWNPRIVAWLGASRARRWAAWWRANISGLAANVSLGMMLGLVPAVASFFALPLEVRHVTLSTGQIGAAIGALGWPAWQQPALWWCLVGIAVTGVLNVTVSFWCAFQVALRARGVQVRDRARIGRAIRQRLRSRPLSFVWPVAPMR